jgi:hypothetical protein
VLHTKHQPARIEEIIDLVRQQEPERQDVVKALKKCSGGKWTSSGYYQFTAPKKGNKGAEWRFYENIILEHEFLGFIVLDVLRNGRIGGIEFIDMINE